MGVYCTANKTARTKYSSAKLNGTEIPDKMSSQGRSNTIKY